MGERMTPAELDAAEARADAALKFDGHADDFEDAAWASVQDVPQLVAEVRARDTVIEAWKSRALAAKERERKGDDSAFDLSMRLGAAEAVIEAVRSVHWLNHPYAGRSDCGGCFAPWPCATIRALEGATE